MRQADGDMKKKYDAERRHQLIRYRLLAAFSSVTLGEDSLLDDLDAGDDLALVINSLDSNDDDLHGRLLSLPRGDCRPLSVWRASYA